MGKVKISAVGLAVCLGLALAVSGVTAAAESPGKLTRAVYLTATKTVSGCACSLKGFEKADGVVGEAFAGSHPEILQRIDVSTNTNAETYLRKYNLSTARLPVLLFLDAGDNLLWKSEEKMNGEEIIKKMREFGQ